MTFDEYHAMLMQTVGSTIQKMTPEEILIALMRVVDILSGKEQEKKRKNQRKRM